MTILQKKNYDFFNSRQQKGSIHMECFSFATMIRQNKIENRKVILLQLLKFFENFAAKNENTRERQ